MGLFDDYLPPAASGNADGGNPNVPRITVTPRDAGGALNPGHRDLAIRTIYGEAANEPDQGQAAVAAVIKNRMQAGRYGGDTIPGVVLAKGQFEPWSNPEARARMAALKPDDPNYQKIGGIVDQVFGGQMEDPTGGATHFVAPQAQAALGRQMPSWAQGEGQPIGRHTFFAPEGRVGVTDVSAQSRQPGGIFGDWLAPRGQAAPPDAAPALPADNGGQFAAPLASGQNIRTAREGPSPAVATPGQAFMGHAAQAATFNFGDELVGVLKAGGYDPNDPVSLNNAISFTRGLAKLATGDPEAQAKYRVITSNIRETLDRTAEQQPAAAIGGDLVGGMATVPLTGGAGIAAKGAGMGARALQGAKVGAIQGALAGAGGGTDLESRASGAAGGGAAGGVIGGAAGAVVPPLVSAAVSPFTRKAAVPTAEELRNAATAAYQSAEVKGLTVKASAVQDFSQTVQADLTKLGIDENLAPKTFAILAKIENAPAGAQATGDNLNTIRRILGTAAGSIDKTERKAAKTAMDALDEFIPNIKPQDVLGGDPAAAAAKWAEARGNFAASMRSEQIATALEKANRQTNAAGSGGNIDNATRQKFKSILDSPAKSRGYSPEELDQMEKIVAGTWTGNTARLIGKAAPTGIVSGGLSAGAGMAAGGPVGAVALPAIGYAAKKLGDALTARQVRILDEMVRSRAPLANSMAAFGTKAQQFQQLRNAASASAAALAARNLSHNLQDAGISISPVQIMRSLQAPATGRAEDNQ